MSELKTTGKIIEAARENDFTSNKIIEFQFKLLVSVWMQTSPTDCPVLYLQIWLGRIWIKYGTGTHHR